MAIVLALFVTFAAACLRLFSAQEIQDAGTNIVFVMAQKIVPGPLADVAVLAVMLSTIGTIETTILQFTRTLFAMSRAGAFHPRYSRLHVKFDTPWVATGVITLAGLVLLLLSTALPGVNTVVKDSVNAIGFQVAFYYSLTCAASAWTLRREWRKFGVLVTGIVWPVLSGICLLTVAALSVPSFDTPTLVVGFGGIALGVVPLVVRKKK
jgi:amino acid transporter